jgi:putative NADH-flavin reductase
MQRALSRSQSSVNIILGIQLNMRVVVIGSTGLGGSYTAKELIERGHNVVGISRNPSKLGEHSSYEPVVLDIVKTSIADIAAAFRGCDCVVNAFNPAMGQENLYSECFCLSLIFAQASLTDQERSSKWLER